MSFDCAVIASLAPRQNRVNHPHYRSLSAPHATKAARSMTEQQWRPMILPPIGAIAILRRSAMDGAAATYCAHAQRQSHVVSYFRYILLLTSSLLRGSGQQNMSYDRYPPLGHVGSVNILLHLLYFDVSSDLLLYSRSCICK